ncbi:hypothetical protein BD408DRAFT_442489 [Parasitella parasitica]|nr:hypothetical protein BD408DRAFT_442489 [Parasitella parasitica]
MRSKAIFETQFPTESVIEISEVNFNEKLQTFDRSNIDIGWALLKSNYYYPNERKMEKNKGPVVLGEDEYVKDKRITKRCACDYYCNTSKCPGYGRPLRPHMNEHKAVKDQICNKCKIAMEKRPCLVVKQGTKVHSHGKYLPIHLTSEEQKQIDLLTKEDPFITPIGATTGISSTAKRIKGTPSINKILSNKDRTRYHLRESKHAIVRVSRNHKLVPPEKLNVFKKLVYDLRTTTYEETYKQAIKAILSNFPYLKTWLMWLVQLTTASTIFACPSVMNLGLQMHESRTTNSVEVYHKKLYTMIPTRLPVSTALKLILEVSRRDGEVLQNVLDYNIPISYGSQAKIIKKTKKSKPLDRIEKAKKKRKQKVSEENTSQKRTKKVKTALKEESDVYLKAYEDEYVDEPNRGFFDELCQYKELEVDDGNILEHIQKLEIQEKDLESSDIKRLFQAESETNISVTEKNAIKRSEAVTNRKLDIEFLLESSKKTVEDTS